MSPLYINWANEPEVFCEGDHIQAGDRMITGSRPERSSDTRIHTGYGLVNQVLKGGLADESNGSHPETRPI